MWKSTVFMKGIPLDKTNVVFVFDYKPFTIREDRGVLERRKDQAN